MYVIMQFGQWPSRASLFTNKDTALIIICCWHSFKNMALLGLKKNGDQLFQSGNI